MNLAPGQRAKTLRGEQEQWAMKFFTGCIVSAGLVVAATGAQAQLRKQAGKKVVLELDVLVDPKMLK